MAIRYILGIDFGHGETTAAVYDLDDHKIRDVEITKDVTCKKTAICRLQVGVKKEYKWLISPTPSIIKTALQQTKSGDMDGFNFFTYFKGPLIDSKDGKIKSISDEKREQFGRYICEVYRSIMETNNYLDPIERNFALYVACPSGWDKNQAKAYKEFINSLEVLITDKVCQISCVDVVKESDAAYVYSRDKVKAGVFSVKDNPSVLVIDYGSSTIDFTWYGREEPIHDGAELGASKVENILFDYMMEHEECAKKAFEDILPETMDNKTYLRNIIVYALRESKENFYRDLADSCMEEFAQLEPIVIKKYINIPRGVDFGFDNDSKTYNIKDLHEIMDSSEECLIKRIPNTNTIIRDNRNYCTKVKEAFEDFKYKIGGSNVDYVILTGGASYMDFVLSFTKEIFQVSKENNTLLFDSERNYSISRGIAKWGQFHHQSTPIIDEINKKLKEEWAIEYNSYECRYIFKTNKNIITRIKDDAIKAIQELYKTEILQLLNCWTSESNDIQLSEAHTLNDEFGQIISTLYDADGSISEEEKQLWDKIKYAINSNEACVKCANGQRSLHALFRRIFDCIDSESENLDVKDIKDCINNELNKLLETKVTENIGELMKKFRFVYFPTDESAIPIKLDLTFKLSIEISQKEKLHLLRRLVVNSYENIDERRSFIRKSSIYTLNNDREYENSVGVDGRKHFTSLEEVLINFAESIKPKFTNLESEIVKCQEQIVANFEQLKRDCTLSVYQINNTIFDDKENG